MFVCCLFCYVFVCYLLFSFSQRQISNISSLAVIGSAALGAVVLYLATGVLLSVHLAA